MSRRHSSDELYKFLEDGKYMDSPERRKLGTKLFRKEYLKRKKQQYRAKNTEHTIIFKPADENVLKNAANKHNMTVTNYIRHAVLAYSGKCYVVPRLNEIFSIEKQLIYARTQIDRISKEKPSVFGFGKSQSEKIEDLLTELNGFVHSAFKEPKDSYHCI